MSFDSEETTFRVVVNAEEQYSIWPDYKEVPRGWTEVGKRLIQLNQENMTIIGTIGALPKPVIVKSGMHNLYPQLGDTTVHFNFGYMYPFRPDQWYKG